MFMWAISVIQVNEIILLFCIFQVFVGVKPVCVGRYVTVSFSFSRFFCAFFPVTFSHRDLCFNGFVFYLKLNEIFNN